MEYSVHKLPIFYVTLFLDSLLRIQLNFLGDRDTLIYRSIANLPISTSHVLFSSCLCLARLDPHAVSPSLSLCIQQGPMSISFPRWDWRVFSLWKAIPDSSLLDSFSTGKPGTQVSSCTPEGAIPNRNSVQHNNGSCFIMLKVELYCHHSGQQHFEAGASSSSTYHPILLFSS